MIPARTPVAADAQGAAVGPPLEDYSRPQWISTKPLVSAQLSTTLEHDAIVSLAIRMSDSLSGSAFTQGFVYCRGYLRDSKIHGETHKIWVKSKITEKHPQWGILAYLRRVTGGQVKGLPFSWKLKAKAHQ